MAPRWIIIDSRDAVEKFLFNGIMVDGCTLSIEDVIGSLVACAMHRDERDEDLLAYLTKVGLMYKDSLPDKRVSIIIHALSLFARFLFAKIDELNMYSHLGIFWYEYHSLLGYDIVLKNVALMGD